MATQILLRQDDLAQFFKKALLQACEEVGKSSFINFGSVVHCKDCAYRYDGVVCPIASLIEETTPRGDLRKRETDIYAPDDFFCANGSLLNRKVYYENVQ